MTDIDFAELDKAVNSLMGTVGTETIDEGEKLETLSIRSTLKPDERPAFDKVGQAAKEIGNETLVVSSEQQEEKAIELDATTDEASNDKPSDSSENEVIKTHEKVEEKVVTPVQRPPSGRFMDVVHPSSDMRFKTTPTDSVVPYQSNDTSTPEMESEQQQEADTEQDAPVTEVVDSQHVSTDSSSLTPFLPNTKVEKRPLGNGFAVGVGAVPWQFASDDAVAKEKETQLSGETPMAEADDLSNTSELHTVAAINGEVSEKESHDVNDTQVVLDPEAFESKISAENEALQSIESEELPESGEVMTPSIRAVESGDTEKVSTSSLSKHDNSKKTNIQPLSHPVKQKSGWGIVGIIALIIVIFAIIGVAAYFILGTGF